MAEFIVEMGKSVVVFLFFWEITSISRHLKDIKKLLEDMQKG